MPTKVNKENPKFYQAELMLSQVYPFSVNETYKDTAFNFDDKTMVC